GNGNCQGSAAVPEFGRQLERAVGRHWQQRGWFIDENGSGGPGVRLRKRQRPRAPKGFLVRATRFSERSNFWQAGRSMRRKKSPSPATGAKARFASVERHFAKIVPTRPETQEPPGGA